MITFPNAKINLGLSVVAKRSDGYHDLETVFYPVGLRDALEITQRQEPGCTLFVSGIEIGGNQEDNLVVKAYRMLQQKFELPGINIYLHKTIPFGAGMGGGSSDAAFMLTLLNDYFALQLTPSVLEKQAAILGADCPFFCRNIPVYAEGTGNLFSPIKLSLKGYYLVIVKPSINVSTKDAFSGITPAKPVQSVHSVITTLPTEQWKGMLKNDFENTVFKLYPRLQEIKESLYDAGAIYASMSGSGSSLFGIFKHPVHLESLFADCFVWEGPCEY